MKLKLLIPLSFISMSSILLLALFSNYAFAGEYYSDFKLSIDPASSYYSRIADVRFSYNCLDRGIDKNWHLALHDENNHLFSLDRNLNCGSPHSTFSWLTTTYKIKGVHIKLSMIDFTEKSFDIQVVGYMKQDGKKINCHINEADQPICKID